MTIAKCIAAFQYQKPVKGTIAGRNAASIVGYRFHYFYFNRRTRNSTNIQLKLKRKMTQIPTLHCMHAVLEVVNPFGRRH
jgi:hypothetical protein